MLFGFPPKEVGIKPDSEIFRLMTQIQDEVHRFAITHHRKQFEKGFIHSELADIKGIGKATAEKLLLELKSVKAIKEASLERLASLIGPAKAKIVFDHFR
jgi:excinuclease ABC subunit C